MQVAPDPSIDVRPKCTVCWEQVMLNGYALMNCCHVFHPLCITRAFRGKTNPECPNCRSPVDSSVLIDLGIEPVSRSVDISSDGPTTTVLSGNSIYVSNCPANRSENPEYAPNRPSLRPNGLVYAHDSSSYRPYRPEYACCNPSYRSGSPEYRATSPTFQPIGPFSIISQSPIVSVPSSAIATIADPAHSHRCPFHDSWSKTFSKLMSENDESLDSISSESHPQTSLEKPAFYRTSTLKFLKRLKLTDSECDQLVAFKRQYGKYALCDVVIRVKVFLALDRDFRFTSLDDMLHQCKTEYRSARVLEKIYLKYMRDNPLVQTSVNNGNDSSTVRGSVYNFFDLPEPRVLSPSSTLLEKSFQNIIQKGFGVTLPVVNRDLCLLTFYTEHPHNMHNVLRYAKLRSKEKELKKQIQGLKSNVLGCRRSRRNGWY